MRCLQDDVGMRAHLNVVRGICPDVCGGGIGFGQAEADLVTASVDLQNGEGGVVTPGGQGESGVIGGGGESVAAAQCTLGPRLIRRDQ